MTTYPVFSHAEYKFIMKTILENLPVLDYQDINTKTESYCVIRHDIEFSLERAYQLAVIENELGISTSYFIQLNNNVYNGLSFKNINIFLQIASNNTTTLI